jgi:ribosome-dependent ATPase
MEFLLGKQFPYVVLGLVNFVLLTTIAVTIFRVPLTGSIPAFLLAAWLYVMSSTAFGLLISCFVRSQIAGIFGTALLTMLPATQYSGLLDPVSSLEGAGAVIGQLFPTTHFLTISRGIFSKGLGLFELRQSFVALALATPVLLAASAAFLKKQDG